MSLQEDLKKEIDSRDYKSIREKYHESMPKLKTVMEQFQTKKESFIETEFTRYKVKLTKGNFILISELKEDEAENLFDEICKLGK